MLSLGRYEMTLNERIDQQSFCYDPEFPPDVAEGLPLASAKQARESRTPLRRAVRSCGQLVTALTTRRRNGSG